jgi:N6-adenosine-specific RNA methylase IME4
MDDKQRCPVCRKWFVPVRRDAVTCSPRCRMARARKTRADTPPWPGGGPFDFAVVDLPLRWIGHSEKGEGRSPQSHYRTMDVPGLVRMLRPMLDAVMAPNCVVGWWVYGPRALPTRRYGPGTSDVIREIGFDYTNELLAWLKTTRDGRPHMGLGKHTRKCFEMMWGSRRGKGLPRYDRGVLQGIFTEEDLPLVVEAPWRGNSVKPDEAYEALERLYGDVRRLELFARKRRPGWTGWGNDLEEEVEAAA